MTALKVIKPWLIIIALSLPSILLAQEPLTSLLKEIKREDILKEIRRDITKKDAPEPISEEQVILRAIDDLLSPNIIKKRNAKRKLIAFGNKAVPYIIKAFQRPEFELHIMLTNISIEIGGEAEDAFLMALNSERNEVRWHAAKVLGNIGGKRSVGPLIKSLDDPIVRPTAVDALGILGDKEAIPALQKLLDTDDEFVRMLVTQALKRLGVKVQVTSQEN